MAARSLIPGARMSLTPPREGRRPNPSVMSLPRPASASGRSREFSFFLLVHGVVRLRHEGVEGQRSIWIIDGESNAEGELVGEVFLLVEACDVALQSLKD